METRQDGASAAGPRDAFAYELGLVREVVQESQPSTAPAAQGALRIEPALERFGELIGAMIRAGEALSMFSPKTHPDPGAYRREAEGVRYAWDTALRAYRSDPLTGVVAALTRAQPPAASQGMREALTEERAAWATQLECIPFPSRLTSTAGHYYSGVIAGLDKALAALSRSQEAPADPGNRLAVAQTEFHRLRVLFRRVRPEIHNLTVSGWDSLNLIEAILRNRFPEAPAKEGGDRG